MKNILLFGAGKSATVLIDYLLNNAPAGNWMLHVADADINLARSKTRDSPFSVSYSFDANSEDKLGDLVKNSDLVISLLPPQLHMNVAKACLREKKHLLTASYVDESISKLSDQIKESDLIFLCEMGLDPGIDHMSAMKIFDTIRNEGGEIFSFRSHCGGLVAPESDDNPWHYKISWNPRNIVLAGKSGAHFRENNEEVLLSYEQLFSADRLLEIPGIGFFGWYPNRDSLGYAPKYGLENLETMVRTTLRHPDFIYGWKNVVELKLTSEEPDFDSSNKTLMDFFRYHMDKHGFGEWLQQKLSARLNETKNLLENLMKLVDAEYQAGRAGADVPDQFMMVDGKGKLENLKIDDIKTNAAATVAHKMHEANLTMKQLFYLGMDDDQTLINKGTCSAADVMQMAMEKKLGLSEHDKDMVVMFHEIGYVMNGKKKKVESSLVVKGKDAQQTAMAKTVGLPLGIAAKLILAGSIKSRGLLIPVHKEIYEPVLSELFDLGIGFNERIIEQD